MVASLNSYSQTDGIGIRLYNPVDKTFILEDWIVQQLVREREERILLIDEVINKENTIISLETEIDILKLTENNMILTLNNKDKDIDNIERRLILQTDLYNSCIELNGTGESSIKGLEWALKRQKAKTLWYSIGAGTTATLLGILITNYLKNR